MEFVVNGIEFTMVYVKGGKFTMGTDYNESINSWYNSRPIHLVKLTDYYIGRYPVTQELWKAVMDSNPSYFRGRELPVEKVSWEDCQEFVGKLSKMTGKHFVYLRKPNGNMRQEVESSQKVLNMREVMIYLLSLGIKVIVVKRLMKLASKCLMN